MNLLLILTKDNNIRRITMEHNLFINLWKNVCMRPRKYTDMKRRVGNIPT